MNDPVISEQVGELVAPATPFWQGYKRPPQMTADLIATLSELLYAHPEQRFGQVIDNACHRADLFNIYDENLLARLRDALDIDGRGA